MRALIAAAMLVSLLSPQAIFADPLHKIGKQGDWRHADSGWIFPARISGLGRVGSPYQIDGNNDVGAEYVAHDFAGGAAGGSARGSAGDSADGSAGGSAGDSAGGSAGDSAGGSEGGSGGESAGRRSALVDVFLPDSAAAGATLAGARAALLKSGGAAPEPTETPFPIPGKPEVTGVKLAIVPGGGAERLLLYFFTAPGCVISVRASVPAEDPKAGDSMDEFVRAMRWDTLGVFDGDMHGGGS